MTLATTEYCERALRLPIHASAAPYAWALAEDQDHAEGDDRSDGDEETVVVPQVDESERARIRESNDRDQVLEREGETAPHNEGYDDAAKGVDRSR